MLPLLILNPHCLPSEPLFFLLDYDGYHRMSRAGNSFSWLSVGILKWVSAKQVQDFSTFFPSHSHADTEEGKRGTGPNIKCCSVTQLCPTLWDPMDYSMPGFSVHHQLPELAQTHVHWVSEAIQPSHPLSSPSPPDLNLSQHHGLFKWVRSSHQVAKILEFQLHHQSFQWTLRTDLL